MQPAAFWEGQTKGKEVKLGGHDTYLTQPESSSSKGIVIIPDVNGTDLSLQIHCAHAAGMRLRCDCSSTYSWPPMSNACWMHAKCASHDCLAFMFNDQAVLPWNQLEVSDFAGWQLKNTRLMADKFADNGFIVAIPGKDIHAPDQSLAIKAFHISIHDCTSKVMFESSWHGY